MLLAGPAAAFAGVAELLVRHGIRSVSAGNLAEAQATAPRVAVVHGDLCAGPALTGWLAHLPRTHVILLLERPSAADRIAALEAGADGVLDMPVAPRELVARVRALLRRRPRLRPLPAGQPPIAEAIEAPAVADFGSFRFDARAGRVWLADGREVALGARELGLLAAFAERPRRPLSRRDRAELVGLDGNESDERRIEDSVGRLRRLLQGDGQPPPIVTVSGEGYRFDPPGPSQARSASG